MGYPFYTREKIVLNMMTATGKETYSLLWGLNPSRGTKESEKFKLELASIKPELSAWKANTKSPHNPVLIQDYMLYIIIYYMWTDGQ
jgi:hypothetical protein